MPQEKLSPELAKVRNEKIREYLKNNPSKLKSDYSGTAKLFNTTSEIVRHQSRALRDITDLPSPEFKIDDEILRRRENGEIKALKRQIEHFIKDYERLSDAYEIALNLKTQDVSFVDSAVIEEDTSKNEEAAVVIQLSDCHFGKTISPSSVNRMNNYNLDIARDRMDTLAENFIKLVKKERHDIKIENLVLILGGDFLENSQLHEHSEMTTSLSPMEETLFAREVLVRFIRTIQDYCDFKNVLVPCVYGNHCISADTEVLTPTGWVNSTDLKLGDHILAFDKSDGRIEEVTIEEYNRFMHNDNYRVHSKHKDELITNGHNLVVDGEFVKVEDAYQEERAISNDSFIKSGLLNRVKNDKYSDFDLKFITWIVTDGTIVHKSKYNTVNKNTSSWRIQFKLSKERKIKELTKLLDDNNIPYTLATATMSGANRLQPYYIRLYGEVARKYCEEYLNGIKQFPDDFSNLNTEQLNSVLDVIEITDGTTRGSNIEWSSVCYENIDIIQRACITNNIEFRYTTTLEESIKKQYIKKIKTRYTASIYNKNIKQPARYVTIEKINDLLEFVLIANSLGTLITRRNGIVNFTGNSRSTRKMDPSIDHRMSYESILYNILKQDFSDSNFKWIIPDSGIIEFSVFNRKMRTFHGHQVKYGGGIGGLTIPLNKFIMRLDQSSPCQYNFLHHYHNYSFPTSKSTLNGSLIGIDPFAYSLGCEYQPPIQSFQLIDKRRGMTVRIPIMCEK